MSAEKPRPGLWSMLCDGCHQIVHLAYQDAIDVLDYLPVDRARMPQSERIFQQMREEGWKLRQDHPARLGDYCPRCPDQLGESQ